ncbi:MAG: hypothetical protein QNL68_11690 [Akkermansiaceae bacterium]
MLHIAIGGALIGGVVITGPSSEKPPPKHHQPNRKSTGTPLPGKLSEMTDLHPGKQQ